MNRAKNSKPCIMPFCFFSMFLTEDFANFVDYEGVVEEESQEEAVKRYYSSKAWAGVLKNLIDQLSFWWLGLDAF